MPCLKMVLGIEINLLDDFCSVSKNAVFPTCRVSSVLHDGNSSEPTYETNIFRQTPGDAK